MKIRKRLVQPQEEEKKKWRQLKEMFSLYYVEYHSLVNNRLKVGWLTSTSSKSIFLMWDWDSCITVRRYFEMRSKWRTDEREWEKEIVVTILRNNTPQTQLSSSSSIGRDARSTYPHPKSKVIIFFVSPIDIVSLQYNFAYFSISISNIVLHLNVLICITIKVLSHV